jgi:hypothetical protein
MDLSTAEAKWFRASFVEPSLDLLGSVFRHLLDQPRNEGDADSELLQSRYKVAAELRSR